MHDQDSKSELIDIKVQLLHPAAKVPTYAHTGPYGDLCADLYAVAFTPLMPKIVAAVKTGIALEFAPEYGALVEDRSGLACQGITILAGVIDPGYRGELKVMMLNTSSVVWSIQPGDRIAQLRIVRRYEATFTVVNAVAPAPRGSKGFGSTGR